jgi:hypothetical protein
MSQRTSSIEQFMDITGAIMLGMLSIIFFSVGASSLFDKEWKVGVVCSGVALSSGLGCIARFRAFRAAMRADRKFEAEHKGALDWKGDPRDR